MYYIYFRGASDIVKGYVEVASEMWTMIEEQKSLIST